ncbi:PadR family transcriptional regulator [Bordetella sp. 2513F-2]
MKPPIPDGAHDWRRGRKFSSEDLQLMLLGLLEAGPSHGYELMKALAARTNGYYAPSPGMVYPALACLEDQGLALAAAEGGKKRYHLTDAGAAQLAQQRERLAEISENLAHVARKMAWMQRAWSGDAPRLGDEGQDLATGWVPEFVDARQALKAAMLRRSGAAPAEQRRIAAILRRAVADIDAGSSCT